MSSESHNQIAVRGRMGEWDITPHIRSMSVTPLMENSFPIADVTLVGVENKYTARADSPLYSRPPILLEASKDGGNTFHTLLKGVVMEPEHTVGGDGSTLIRLRCQGGGCLTHLAINPNNVAMGGFWGVAELFRGSPLTGNRGGDGVWDQDEQGNFPNGLLYKTGYRYEGVEELFEDLPDVPATYAPTNYYVFDAIREVCDTYGLIFFIDDEDGAIRVLESPTIAPFPPHPTARFERGFNISTLNDANDHRRIYDKVLVLGEGVHYVKGEGHRVYIHRDTELSSIEDAMEVADKVYRRMVRVEDGPEWHQTVITAPPVVEKIVGRSAFIRDPSLSWEGYRNVVGLSHDISEGRWSSTITLESRQRTVPITLAEIMAKEDEKEGGEAQAILTVTDPILDSDVLTRFTNPVGIQFRDRLSGAKLLKPHTDIDLSWDGKRYSSFDVIGSSEGLDTFTDMDFIFNDESAPGQMKRMTVGDQIIFYDEDTIHSPEEGVYYQSVGVLGDVNFPYSLNNITAKGELRDFPDSLLFPVASLSCKPIDADGVGFFSTEIVYPAGVPSSAEVATNASLNNLIAATLPNQTMFNQVDGWYMNVLSAPTLTELSAVDDKIINITMPESGNIPSHNLGALLFRYKLEDVDHLHSFMDSVYITLIHQSHSPDVRYGIALYNYNKGSSGGWEVMSGGGDGTSNASPLKNYQNIGGDHSLISAYVKGDASAYISSANDVMCVMFAYSSSPISSMRIGYSDMAVSFHVGEELEAVVARVLERLDLTLVEQVYKAGPLVGNFLSFYNDYEFRYTAPLSMVPDEIIKLYMNATWDENGYKYISPTNEEVMFDLPAPGLHRSPVVTLEFDSSDNPYILYRTHYRQDLGFMSLFPTELPPLGSTMTRFLDYSITYNRKYRLPAAQTFTPSASIISDTAEGWRAYILSDSRAPALGTSVIASANYFGGEVAARAEFRNPSRVPHGMDMIPFKEALIQTEIDMDNVEQTHREPTPAQIMGLGCEEVGNKPDRRAE